MRAALQDLAAIVALAALLFFVGVVVPAIVPLS